MGDVHADCRYWSLTPAQCSRYHRRLSGYYAALVSVSAAKTRRAALLGLSSAAVALAVALLAIALQAVTP